MAQMVCFIDEGKGRSEGASVTIIAYEAGEKRWEEACPRAGLRDWLRTATASGRLAAEAERYWVLPETQLWRTLLASDKGQRWQRRGIAKSQLALLADGPVALLSFASPENGVATAVGVAPATLSALQNLLGAEARRFRLIGAGDLRLTQGAAVTGYVTLREGLANVVFAVKDGRILASAHGQHTATETLRRQLLLRTPDLAERIGSDAVISLQPDANAVPSAARLQACALPLSAPVGRSISKGMLALLVVAVVLPGCLLATGWSPHTAEETPVAAEGATQVPAPTVARSDYGSLIDAAYAAKTSRLTLLSHDAADGALAISGRCQEPLDLAAYMKALAEAKPALHPLLLDLTEQQEEDKTHYTFTVQISLKEATDHADS
ncbi:MAG: hypothetical protein Q4C56_05605 [Peptococcaceae bacterium]|nr:hypothetical protein [Peptococcaceae bacterium]